MERIPMNQIGTNYQEIEVGRHKVGVRRVSQPEPRTHEMPHETPKAAPAVTHREFKDTQHNILWAGKRVRKVASYALQVALAAGVVNVAGHTAADALPFYSDPDGFRAPTSVENVVYDLKAVPAGSKETFNEFASLAEQVGDMGDDTQ